MQKKIELTIRGVAVITKLDGELHKVTIKEKTDKDKLKKMVDNYNKKPSEYWVNRIRKVFAPKVEVSKAKVESKKAKKAVKLVRAKSKTAKAKAKIAETVAAIAEEAAPVIEKQAEVIKEVVKDEPTPVVGNRYSGEYYGRRN